MASENLILLIFFVGLLACKSTQSPAPATSELKSKITAEKPRTQDQAKEKIQPALRAVVVEDFVSLCTQTASEANLRSTIDLLLNLAGSRDCPKAWLVLQSMERMDLTASEIVELSLGFA